MYVTHIVGEPQHTNNSKEPQQQYHLGTVSINILEGLNRFHGIQHEASATDGALTPEVDVQI